MHTLYREQRVPADPQTCWEFLEHPRNLEKITPPDLSFEIPKDLPEKMSNGILVTYRIKVPFFGSFTWISEIKHIVPGQSFVDEQRKGPYKFWYHYHEVRPDGEGSLLIDRVHYQLPFGPLGQLVHWLKVKSDLEKIFIYRNKVLEDLFGKSES